VPLSGTQQPSFLPSDRDDEPLTAHFCPIVFANSPELIPPPAAAAVAALQPASLAGSTHNASSVGVSLMKLSLRTVALGSFVFTLIAAALFAYPALAEESGTDFWNVFELQDRMAQAEQESRRAEREAALVMNRLAVRHEIIRDVMEGRMTMEEASQRYAELNKLQPPALEYVRRVFPGRTDEERAAWQLAAHLRRFGEPAAEALGEEWECVLTSRQ
jgi:hypothetical protein